MAKKVEVWAVGSLKPYTRNARTHDAAQVTKIAASIAEFGFTNPILVDSASGIIAGHGRLMAAKELGLAEVPVIILDHLTDAQRRAYILADNRLALDAGWDNDVLAAELADLRGNGFDLDLTGFLGDEVKDIIGEGNYYEEDEDEDGDGDEDGKRERVSFQVILDLTKKDFDALDVFKRSNKMTAEQVIMRVVYES